MSNLFAFGDKVIGGGESSQSDGHIIQNPSGTAMPTQPNLKFADANVENDSTNNATVIHNFIDIDWDDWQEVDDNDNTYYRVTNAPLADGNIEVDLMKKLWENPDPNSAFADQNITLSSDDYDFLFVNARNYATGTEYNISSIGRKGAGQILFYSNAQNNGALTARRFVAYVSNTELNISSASYIQGGSTTPSVDNTFIIPIAIYGIKQKVSISLSAIISNVSTSAENCMMPDGETSVADKFDELELHNGGTRVDIKSYTSASNAFVIPADGYIEANAANASGTNGIVQLRGSDNNLIGFIGADYPNISTTYVRKGMRAFTQTATANMSVVYIPFV